MNPADVLLNMNKTFEAEVDRLYGFFNESMNSLTKGLQRELESPAPSRDSVSCMRRNVVELKKVSKFYVDRNRHFSIQSLEYVESRLLEIEKKIETLEKEAAEVDPKIRLFRTRVHQEAQGLNANEKYLLEKAVKEFYNPEFDQEMKGHWVIDAMDQLDIECYIRASDAIGRFLTLQEFARLLCEIRHFVHNT